MLPFIASFIVWSVLHSVTAARRSKRWVRRQVGDAVYEGLYRLGYNIFAFVTFLPVLYLLAFAVPATAVWRVPAPVDGLFWLIRIVGVVGLVVAFLQTDVWDFVGVRQAWRYWRGTETAVSSARLVTDGLYRWVRHPLYLFSMLAIWFAPTMSLNGLIFNSLATVYFWVGSSYEERRLTADFGDEYRAYKQRVPRLFPLKLPRATSDR